MPPGKKRTKNEKKIMEKPSGAAGIWYVIGEEKKRKASKK